MMQVSSLYAHSFERQLVARRSHILQNISRSCTSVDPQAHHKDHNHQAESQQNREEPNTQKSPASPADVQSLVNELFLTEAGILPPELRDEVQYSANQCSTLIHNNSTACGGDTKQETVDAKEFSDRLCKLPSQCKGGYILGSPRRHPGNMTSATRLCQSAGHLNLTSDYSLMKTTPNSGKKAVSASENASKSSVSDSSDRKGLKKGKGKEKKDAKKLPSNFMYLGTWSTRQNSEKLLEEVRSGDVLEFNIKFHHHWGIALVNKNKKPTLENLELIHLKKDNKTDSQKAVKQTLAEYWIEGVTARINNSRDVHKQPLPAADVIASSLKVVTQPYRIWQNSEQLITHCRYGEGVRSRQMSDAARWGSLSKCVGLWLSLTSSRSSSPSTSPAIRRKRTLSVNF